MSNTPSTPVPRPGILSIEAYVPGQSTLPGSRSITKLASNENPLGPSPAALSAFRDAGTALARYPDGAATPLREAIAEINGIDANQIVCGSGSDEILNLLAAGYLGPGDEAIHTEHGFLVYPIATMARGATPIVAPERNLTTSVDAILNCVNDRTKIVFIANPNNPTGTYIPIDEVRRLRTGLPDHVILVLDGAYCEYVRADDYEAGIELVATTPNTVMTRTFSKIYGLASLRLGWAFCPPEVAGVLNRIRGPFNVSGPAIAAGVAAINDKAHVAQAVAHNDTWLKWLAGELKSIGLDAPPSVANFLLVQFPGVGEQTAERGDAFLKQRRILLRRMENYGLPNALRLTVGLETENKAVINALRDFMRGAAS